MFGGSREFDRHIMALAAWLAGGIIEKNGAKEDGS